MQHNSIFMTICLEEENTKKYIYLNRANHSVPGLLLKKFLRIAEIFFKIMLWMLQIKQQNPGWFAPECVSTSLLPI